MTSQSPRIYTYKITFEEVPHYYYGYHKEKKYGEEYWGSPITHKWMWDFYTPEKQILELFEFNDEGYKEAGEVEKRLIRPVYNTDPYCLNENCGGVLSIDSCRRGGKISGKISGLISGPKTLELGIGIHGLDEKSRIENARKAGLIGGKIAKDMGVGIHALTTEERIEAGRKGGPIGGKIAGPKTYELGIGIHSLTHEEICENAKKGGIKAREENLGIFAMTSEERSEAGRKGGKISGEQHKENGTGIFSMTPEEWSEAGRKGGKSVFENGLGCFSLTPEERVEVSRKVGLKAKEEKKGIFAMTAEEKAERSRKVGLQKWRCLVTGYVSNSGNLSQFQKKHGIDTSLRERIE